MRKSFILQFLLVFLVPAFGVDYLDIATKQSTGQSVSSLKKDRLEDIIYVFYDPMCCCNAEILAIFTLATSKMTTIGVNPATDHFISSLAMLKDENNLFKDSIVYQKLINAMYSFSDIGGEKTMRVPKPSVSSDDNCIPIDFDNPEDRAKYLELIDSVEAGGDYSKEGERSSAYGRYQIMPSTAEQYCAQAGDCCGDKWKNSPACQDAIFEALTRDNISSAQSSGIEINTCTVYLMHQQGYGGFLWMSGGSNPYSSTEKLEEVVRNNVSQSAWEKAVSDGLTSTEDGLREVMVGYWEERLGGDIFGDHGGDRVPPDELAGKAHEFNQNIEKLKEIRKELYRKGILLDMKHENHLIDRMIHLYDKKNSDRSLDALHLLDSITKEEF